MNGIFYFSSTGNSLYLAKRAREKMGGQIRYIPRYTGDGSEYEKILLVSPVYSFGLPTPVYELLLRLEGTIPLYILLNYGGMAGGADRLAWELAKKHGKDVRGVYKLKMPENYTLTLSTPAAYNRAVLKKAGPGLERILCRRFASGGGKELLLCSLRFTQKSL